MENNGKAYSTSRKKAATVDPLVYGKVPPHDRNAEEAVLGAIMIEKGVYELVLESTIKPECFYFDAHRIIFSAFDRLFKRRSPIDIVTVVDDLRAFDELDKVGGPYAVSKLTNGVVSSAHIDTHCKIIYQHFIRRELARIGGEITNASYDPTVDSFDLVTDAEYKVRTVTLGVSELNKQTVADIAVKTFDKFYNSVHNARNGIVDPDEVYTGIEDWDYYNGPLKPGCVYVVAGRPGMGKGVLMSQLAVNMSKKVRVGICNGEMPEDQTITRIGANIVGLSNEILNKEKHLITDEELQLIQEAYEAAYPLPIEIDSTTDIDRARGSMHVWVKLRGVKVIMLDFITMYSTKGSKRTLNSTEQAEYVMNLLVDTAKELKVPIIAFAQLNRESIAKGNVREPNLSDLKRAGEIEEKAYQVIFLHRPEYYTPDQALDEHGHSTQGLMYMICGKYRGGKTFRLKKRFSGDTNRIESWQDAYIPFTPSPDHTVSVNYRLPYSDNTDLPTDDEETF